MDYIIPGLVSGSVLLLATVGFALTRRVEGFLNIAHAQLLVVGGFGTYYFNVELGLPIIVSGVLGVLLTVVVGVVSARLVYWPLRGEPHVISLIASVGLAFLLGGLTEAFIGHGARTLNVPLFKTIEVAGFRIAALDQLITIGIALVSVLGIHMWLSRSRSGRAVRAMASDRHLAEVRGVDTSGLLYLVWGVASGLAGLAGVMIALSSRVYAEMGWDQILLIAAAAIVGGLSNIYGVMGAAVLVGLAASLTSLVLPLQYGQFVVFAMIVAVVFFRPSGLAADAQERVA